MLGAMNNGPKNEIFNISFPNSLQLKVREFLFLGILSVLNGNNYFLGNTFVISCCFATTSEESLTHPRSQTCLLSNQLSHTSFLVAIS